MSIKILTEYVKLVGKENITFEGLNYYRRHGIIMETVHAPKYEIDERIEEIHDQIQALTGKGYTIDQAIKIIEIARA